jgi:hypothetical protein
MLKVTRLSAGVFVIFVRRFRYAYNFMGTEGSLLLQSSEQATTLLQELTRLRPARLPAETLRILKWCLVTQQVKQTFNAVNDSSNPSFAEATTATVLKYQRSRVSGAYRLHEIKQYYLWL